MTGKDVLPEKDLLEKVATKKRYEYLSLGKQLKSETVIAKMKKEELDKNLFLKRIIKKVNEPLIKKKTNPNS